MAERLDALRPEAIETLAQIVGENYTGSEITRLFARGGSPEFVHGNETKWRFVAAAFDELQRRGGGQPHAVLQIIKTMCNPQGYVGQRDRFEGVLKAVNGVLDFYGLRIADDGELRRTGERASTVRHEKTQDEIAFDGRGFHPQVRRHGRSHFCRGAYFHAVFESCKAFDAAVRSNSGIDKSGQPLMSEALSLAGPIKLNMQAAQSEKDEQSGVMFLCMGLMNAVRNPQAHEPELHWPMTREDALDVLGLISFLFRKLEKALVVRGVGGGLPVTL
ncbi:MAG: TIGR02391 family protein [Candidatus Binatia bacterium]